jgi:hypothetical protein
MDKTVMLMWVEKIIKPYLMIAPVVGKIQELSVEVQHIPGECTSLYQLVHIWVIKPFKNWICEQGRYIAWNHKFSTQSKHLKMVHCCISESSHTDCEECMKTWKYSWFSSETNEKNSAKLTNESNKTTNLDK